MTNKGAMTIGEGHWDRLYKVDASLTFSSESVQRKFVLRTTLDDIGRWRHRVTESLKREPKVPLSGDINSPAIVPFKRFTQDKFVMAKECAIVNNELWVFGVNGTIANDIFHAVKIGMAFYKVSAADIIGDIYVKNLNIEYENEKDAEARITANKRLYQNTCEAIKKAAQLLGINSGTLNFWVMSHLKNPKIPGNELQKALKDGGASDVQVSEKSHQMLAMQNDWQREKLISNHLYLAKLDL
jgi:hypothetical protein